MINITKCRLGMMVAACVFSVDAAHAVQCEGSAARKYEQPATVHKNGDGSFVLQFKSTGVSMQTMPSAEKLWQHCTGLWTVNADKSGSGFGSCYAMNDSGEYHLSNWSGSNEAGKRADGEWTRVAGSGAYEQTVGSKGKWSSGARFAEGFRVVDWKGDCL